MEKCKRIETIAIDKLMAHPANPNRMKDATFKKLVRHIGRSGNYEPIIVRRYQGAFEIVNGHHRVKALKQLGVEKADCVVWEVDDDEALVLLATLNRLAGGDDLEKKSQLIKKLSERFGDKDLFKMLPENRKAIDRLKNLAVPTVGKFKDEAFLNPVVFFLGDDQEELVDRAIEAATEGDAELTTAQKRAGAIVRIAEMFLQGVCDE